MKKKDNKSRDFILKQAYKNRMKYLNNAAEFYRTFNVQLKEYWDGNIIGFDIVKFENEIVKSSDNESPKEAIERQWDKRAVRLVKELI